MADTNLAIRITADTRDLLGALKQGSDALDQWAEKFSSVGRSLSVLAIGAALMKVAGQISEVTAAAGRMAEETGHASEQTGVATAVFQQLAPVLNRTGLSTQDLAIGFKTLSRNVIEAQNPSSQAAETFRRLGLELTGLETPSEILQLMAERVKLLPDGFEKTALMTDLMGRAGQRLIPIMNEGAQGFARSAAEAKTMGLVLSNETQQSLKAVDDSFDDVKTAADNFGTHLGVAFAPAGQAFNELKVKAYDMSTYVVDQFTIASRTLAERGKGLFGFLSDIIGGMKYSSDQIVEAWKKWDEQTAKNVQSIRDAGITLQGLGNAFTQADAHVQTYRQGLLAAGDAQERLGIKIRDSAVWLERLPHWLAEFNAPLEAGDTAMKSWLRTYENLRETAAQKLGAMFGERISPDVMDAELEKGNAVLDLELRRRALAQETIVHLRDEAAVRQSYTELETAQYSISKGLIGASEAARAAAFLSIEAKQRHETSVVKENLRLQVVTEDQATDQIIAIRNKADAARIQAVQQFPTFWEQQLQAVVQSNAFSLGTIVSTWTSGIAQMVVKGGNLKQAWEATQIAIVQGMLNASVQMVAQWLLQESARAAATVAANTTIQASNVATATSFSAVAAAAMGAVGAAIASMTASVIAALSAVWLFAKAVLISIAAAMKATIFGIPVGFAITAALIAGSILVAHASKAAAAVLGALAAGTAGLTLFGGAAEGASLAGDVFIGQHGGIFTGPALLAEAGSPALDLPLNHEGLAFMNRLGFGGGKEEIHIHLKADGREFARVVVPHLPRAISGRGASAIP
jgi:hypothetical protein